MGPRVQTTGIAGQGAGAGRRGHAESGAGGNWNHKPTRTRRSRVRPEGRANELCDWRPHTVSYSEIIKSMPSGTQGNSAAIHPGRAALTPVLRLGIKTSVVPTISWAAQWAVVYFLLLSQLLITSQWPLLCETLGQVTLLWPPGWLWVMSYSCLMEGKKHGE